nr:AAA family ATPase [Vibrio sp. Y42_MX_L11]
MVINGQKLTLVRGIPGSGKSTHAKTLDAKLVEADQFFIDKDGLYQYDNAQIKNAHNWCKLETTRLLKAGFNVVVANTFVKNWEMKFYQNLANDMELAFEVIEVKGSYQNVHGVPDSVVERMASQFETLHSSFVTTTRGYAA